MADNFNPDDLMTQPPPKGGVSMKITPKKLSREEIEQRVRKWNPDITDAAVKGEADNIIRESGGNAAENTGDGGTSGGMYQHHNTRLTALKDFARSFKADWTDPDIQIQFSRLEKERDYPQLLKAQQTSNDRAQMEDQFKRIFEKPASVLWSHNANGQPIFGNDRLKWSDHAMREHDNDPLTDIHFMEPQEYLDLMPPLSKPFENASGKALKKSFDRGDQIESIPSLDVSMDGPSAAVTDQDGRHRALLAQQEGLQAIPVAVRKDQPGEPREIMGLNGKLQAFDYPARLLSQVGQALIPRAAAAETGHPDAGLPPGISLLPAQEDKKSESLPEGISIIPSGGPVEQAEQKPGGSIPDWLASVPAGMGYGFGSTVLGAEELVGKGLSAAGATGVGQILTNDARTGLSRIGGEVAPIREQYPIAVGIGEVGGSLVIPGGIGGKLARMGVGPVVNAAIQGGLSGLTTPVGEDDGYWGRKALQTGLGAGVGAAVGKVGNALSKMAAPVLKPSIDLLNREGVELTPGQIAGGKLKGLEDKATSLPFLGEDIKAAVKRSFDTFNKAAVNRGLSEISVTLPKDMPAGREAIAFAQDAFSDAYKQVVPRMRLDLDQGLQRGLIDIIDDAKNMGLPDQYVEQLRFTIGSEIARPFSGGPLTGEQAQMIGTQLDSMINKLRQSGNPYERSVANLLRRADKEVDQSLARQNPVLQAVKDKIDRGYAQFKVVQKASNLSVGGAGDGVFSPYQLNRAAKFSDNSKDDALFARGGALLQDLAEAGLKVLPSTVPDSGTAGRSAIMWLLAHPHLAIPGILGGSTVGLGAYSSGSSKALNYAVNKLAHPGPNMASTGNALARIFQGAGQVGAPVLGGSAAQMMTPPP